MPTVLRWRRYRAFFYSNEGAEPAHIHVRAGDAEVKVWLHDLAVAVNAGFPAHEITGILSHLRANRETLLKAWHEHLEIDVRDLRVKSVAFTATDLVVTLADGRKISTPLDWYPRLAGASKAAREKYEIGALGIHWPEIDEDLSVAGMLAGNRAR